MVFVTLCELTLCDVILQSNVENLSPQVIRGVSKELAELVTNAPEGIRVITNEEDITDIQAFIDGPGNYLLLTEKLLV